MLSLRAGLCASILALASQVSAQVANICPATNVCFKLNIPQNTASSGNGDIFFSISAPSTYEWVALGQGRSMAGSNMFVVYTATGGTNVTISPRTASGYATPSVNSNTQLTLLEGSGVSNGIMTANVKCSNCNSWSGGTMDFTSGSGSWIYAYQSSGGPKNLNDLGAPIKQHNAQASFTWEFANAKGGDSVNPFVTSGSAAEIESCIPREVTSSAPVSSAASASPSSSSAADETNNENDGRRPLPWGGGRPGPTGRPPNKRQASLPYCDELPGSTGGESTGDSNTNADGEFTAIGSSTGESRRTMLIAHGVLASLAFVLFFPFGAILIRLGSFPGVVWLHATFQLIAYMVYIIAFALGVYLATQMELTDSHHPIIGIIVLILICVQPISGWMHHVMYRQYNYRTLWSYGHIWFGRVAITLGIINGGLGLMLANSMNMSSRGGMVAYGIVAALMWLMWVFAMIVGETRRKMAQSARSMHTSKASKSYRSAKSTRSAHSARSAPQSTRSVPQSARSVPQSARSAPQSARSATHTARSAPSARSGATSAKSAPSARSKPTVRSVNSQDPESNHSEAAPDPPPSQSTQGSRSVRSASTRPSQPSQVSKEEMSEASVD